MKEKIFKHTLYPLFFIYFLSIPISYSVANLVITLLLISFIIYLIIFKKIFKSKLYFPIFLFFLIFLISSFSGYDKKVSLREITIFKGFLGMIIAMNTFPKDKKFFGICLLFFLITVFINISLSIFEKFKHGKLYRVEALWGYYQFYSNFLIIAFFTQIFYITYTKNKIFKLFTLLLLILTFFSLILTGSRAQIFSVIISFLIFMIIFHKERIFILFTILIFIITIISFFKIPVFYERVKPLFFKGKGIGVYIKDIEEIKERIRHWKMGIEILKTDYKFFGVGLGNSKRFITERLNMYMNLPNLHNSFIEILVSFGIFGLLIYLYLLFIYFFEIYKSILYFKNTDFYILGINLFIISLIILVIVGFLNDTFWNKRLVMLLFYIAGILFAFKRNENTLSI
ncbi:MAG: O-antigen ligase family protein [candidate division WOR-3 bacterium]